MMFDKVLIYFVGGVIMGIIAYWAITNRGK